MAQRLNGRIAIVTGADSGIGQAIAQAFADEGADVALTYLHDRDGAEATLRHIEGAGRRGKVVRFDQRDPAEVERLFRETRDALGVPFVLVNNAAVGGADGPVHDMSIEDWDRVIRIDLYGPFYCCREFVRARRAAGGRGRIINITSVHEEIPLVGAAAYNAAKGGLRMLTRTLCLELADDRINVNNIAPGMVLTPMNQQAIDDAQARERQVRRIPWKRAAEPREIAPLAVYLASDDADYVTGQTFTIDGGLSVNVGQGA